MKIAYITTYNPHDVTNWSGVGYYIAQTLKNENFEIDYLGPLKDNHEFLIKVKNFYYKKFKKQDYQWTREPLILKNFAKEIQNKLIKSKVNLIFSPGTIPIAYLQTNKPIVFWTDATFNNLLNFYPEYTNLCPETIKNGLAMEKSALQRTALAIYSSEWAARSAIKDFGIAPDKVAVVPFGANIQCNRTIHDIENLAKHKSPSTIKLLFLALEWQRKGGDKALAIVKKLNESGQRAELSIVGCSPIIEPLPEYVKILGLISKATPAGRAQIDNLFAESHFLVLPTLADCTPIVFNEANSFGLPCLTTNVGGNSTIVRDNINGKTFTLDSPVENWCNFILNYNSSPSNYIELAKSCFNEYLSRLNWEAAGKKVKELLLKIP